MRSKAAGLTHGRPKDGKRIVKKSNDEQRAKVDHRKVSVKLNTLKNYCYMHTLQIRFQNRLHVKICEHLVLTNFDLTFRAQIFEKFTNKILLLSGALHNVVKILHYFLNERMMYYGVISDFFLIFRYNIVFFTTCLLSCRDRVFNS